MRRKERGRAVDGEGVDMGKGTYISKLAEIGPKLAQKIFVHFLL